jgi:hypothetical protein
VFTEDLDDFIADFGVAVVFTRGVTTVATATLIFDNPASEVKVYDRSFYDEKHYEASIQGTLPTLHGKAADTASVLVGDKATPTGQGDWYVTAKEPDGTGLVTIVLSRDIPV